MLAPTPLALVPNVAAFWTARRGVLATGQIYCVPRCSKAGGTVSLTTDGGRTYRVVLRTRVAVAYLRIVDGVAYAELQGGGTYVSRHGGHWRAGAQPAAARTPCTGLDVVYTAAAGSRRWALCAGEPGAGNEGKELYVSSGGRWRPLFRIQIGGRPSHGMTSYGYPLGVSFAADGFGLLWESRGTLFVTRDGGRSWIAEPKVARPEQDFGRGASALAGGHGFVLLGVGGTSRARLLRTDDYGRTWRVVHRWR